MIDVVNETPKMKTNNFAFKYSEEKGAVKVELETNTSETVAKVNSFNRFKKQERKRSPLIEVETPVHRPS